MTPNQTLKNYKSAGLNRFFQCGCCGSYHSETLPGYVDCRDDSQRFTIDEIDDSFGPLNWEELEQPE